MTLDLLGELLKHVDLAWPALALLETLHDLVGPLATLSAGRALTAGLVGVEVGETADGADNVGALVHYDNSGSTETGLAVLETVKVHKLVIADALGKNRGGGATGNDGQKVVPAATDTAAVLVDELAQGYRHLLLDGDGVVDVTGNAEELGALVTLTAKAGKPVATASANGGGDSDSLDVGDSGRASEKTDSSGERGFETGLAGLSLEGLDEGGLLTADVGTGTTVDEDVEVVSGVAGVLANQSILVCLVDGVLENGSLVNELAADVDVGGGGVHRSAGDEAALDKLVGILSHNLAVLAGSGLALIGVDDQISRLVVLVPVLEVHE